MAKVTIVGVVGNDRSITLYLDTGETRVLKQSDWKTRQILDKIMPRISVNKPAAIDLEAYSAHAVVERKSGGLLRFVKKAVTSLFTKHEDHDNVSVFVDGKEIPGMQAIEKQIQHAASHDAKGLTIFLQRLAKVIDERGHEVQDLLNFMKAGDLPIADDGTIIAYKKLYAEKDGWYVDPHSRKVRQREGSFVTMAKELVDPSRRTECSTGLHIGRRSYMGGFSGDTIMLVKIAPEDVIAVPQYQADKMRVMGYHIIQKLDTEQYELICRNRPISDCTSGAKLLGRVVAGDHVGIRSITEVKAARGGLIEITGVEEKRVPVDLGRVRLLHTLDSDKSLVVTPKALREEARGYREEARGYREQEMAVTTGTVTAVAITDLSIAAMTGDMSAAINAPEPDEDEDPICDNCGATLVGNNVMCDVCEDDPEWDDTEDEISDEDLEAAADFYDAVVANGGTNDGMGGPLSAPETPAESEEPVTATPAPVDGKPSRDELPEAQQRALALMDKGEMSQREIERQTGVAVRKIKRLIAKGF